MLRVISPTGEVLEKPFLDIRNRMIDLQQEYDGRGLLGLAFHPDYAQNGRFFVCYSAPLRPKAPGVYDSTSHLSEFRVSQDANRADAESEKIRLQVGDWYETNAGSNGQDITHNLLGSILRIDMDGGDPK